MKDEIKEILDKLNEDKDYDDYVDYKGSYFKPLLDYITNLQILYDKTTTDLVKESHARMRLQEENDYLKDIVSKTELSDEIKKADKYSKRELYKINYQRLKANQRLQEENERLSVELNQNMIERNNYLSRNEKAIEYINNLRDESAERQRFYNCFPDDLYIANIEDLIKILQGSDKE